MALRQSVGDLGATFVTAVRTRLELFSLEAEDQRSRLLRLVALSLGALMCLVLALCIFTLLVALYFWPTEYRYVALALLAILYALAGVSMLLMVRSAIVNDPPPFSATLDELRRDAALLDRLRAPVRTPRRDDADRSASGAGHHG